MASVSESRIYRLPLEQLVHNVDNPKSVLASALIKEWNKR